MTDDRGLAALAERLKEGLKADLATSGGNRWPNERFLAIFALGEHGRFIPDDRADGGYAVLWRQALDREQALEAEVERLRAVEVAARDVVEQADQDPDYCYGCHDQRPCAHDALRAALEEPKP